MIQYVRHPYQTPGHAEQSFFSDLNRCEHGRHVGDVCSLGRPDQHCEGGVSLGNPVARGHKPERVLVDGVEAGQQSLIVRGVVIAYGIGGRDKWVLMHPQEIAEPVLEYVTAS